MSGSGAPFAGRLIALVAVLGTAGLLLAPIPPRLLGVWQAEFLDFGHVPLFAALVVALRMGMGPPVRRPLLVAVVLAGLAELVQPWFNRTADWMDFFRGTLGATAGAAGVRAWELRHQRWQSAAYLAAAVALTVWPVVEVVPYLADTVEGRRALPVLADFATDRQMRRWQRDQATIARIAGDGKQGARVEFVPGPGTFSWVLLRPVTSDVRGYGRLNCAIRVLDEPVGLVVSVRTGRDGAKGSAHAQVGRVYAPGEHVIELDLPALVAQGDPVPLDLSDVLYVQFFVVRITSPRTIEISRIWLNP